MSSAPRHRRPRRPQFEALEVRETPATFGAPWTDAPHLSLSFAPDGTPIAGHVSSLFQTLDAGRPTADWQRELLRAFQTWAIQANINIGVAPDSGLALGVAGPAQHDARFGDIRIGAQPMASDALSVSVPYDPAISGTLSGDVLLNSTAGLASSVDLFAVALHEAGHVFGLEHSADPASVMFSHLNPNTTLTAGDIRALQALYGTRSPDAFEGSSGNDTINRASQIPIPGSYTGHTPLVAFGDVTTRGDADVFALPVLNDYSGPVTLRLRSAGISLLAPELSVVDANGAVVASVASSNLGFGDDVTLHLPSLSSRSRLFLRVEGATGDEFGIGAYGLAVTYDGTSTVPAANLDAVLKSDRAGLNPNDLALLLLDPSGALVQDDHHKDDDVAAAVRLDTTPGFAQFTHYEAIGSISDAGDVDTYRIRAAKPDAGQPVVLTAIVHALDDSGIAPRIALLDGELLTPVPARVLANGDGTFTIQATGLKDGGNYYLRVSSGPGGAVGNYSLLVDFGRVPSAVVPFGSGTLTSAAPEQDFDFFVARSGLFQFLLTAGTGAPAGTTVETTVADAAGLVRLTLNADQGDTASAAAIFLTPGQYAIRVRATGPTALAAPLDFDLSGLGSSDPMGPTLQDPTLQPIYTTPAMPGLFAYPTGTTTTMPYLIALKPPLVVAPPTPPTPPTPPATPPASTPPATPPANTPPVTTPPVTRPAPVAPVVKVVKHPKKKHPVRHPVKKPAQPKHPKPVVHRPVHRAPAPTHRVASAN